MDVKELRSVITNDMPPSERIIILATLLDEILKETEIIRKDICCIHEIPISLIDPFPGHPFNVDNDEDLRDLIQSMLRKDSICGK